VHRAIEVGGRPAANARFRIRCDVRREHVAERRVEPQPSGIRFTALGCVAGNAVAGPRAILSKFRCLAEHQALRT
jgi:hypothetical protein